MLTEGSKIPPEVAVEVEVEEEEVVTVQYVVR